MFWWAWNCFVHHQLALPMLAQVSKIHVCYTCMQSLFAVALALCMVCLPAWSVTLVGALCKGSLLVVLGCIVAVKWVVFAFTWLGCWSNLPVHCLSLCGLRKSRF